MKKIVFSMFALAFTALFFTACEKDAPIVTPEEVTQEFDIQTLNITEEDIEITDVEIIDDGATTRAPGPDLVVSLLTSTLTNNGPCAVPVGAPQLPNATCNGSLGGSTAFRLLARITNIGMNAVPAGQLRISFALSGQMAQALTIVNHPGIPAGSSIGVVRGWALPCPTSTPIGLTSRVFTSTVDVGNQVVESNENNNVSRPYTICDDI